MKTISVEKRISKNIEKNSGKFEIPKKTLMDPALAKGYYYEPTVLSNCQLDEVADSVIDTLSHGYRKRVGIAQAILHGPQLVILDEPFSGLDPAQVGDMRAVIRELGKSCTVLVSSHNLHQVQETCDRILVLSEGRLVAQGTEAELVGKVGIAATLKLIVTADAQSLSDILENREDWRYRNRAKGQRHRSP